MSGSYKILMFATDEWSDLWLRRQRFACELAKRPEVASVLYVNPPVTTSVWDLARGHVLPGHLGTDPQPHLKALLGRPCHVSERVWVYTGSEKTLPLTRLPAVRGSKLLNTVNRSLYIQRVRSILNRLPGDRFVLYLTHPLQEFALAAFPTRTLAVYDWTDEWTKFELLPVRDREAYIRLNQRVPAEADVVLAVSHHLHEAAHRLNPRSHWLPNATSLHEFPSDVGRDAIVEATPRPRLGYIGQIGDRVDFKLLSTIAKSHPEWTIVMIGPVWSNRTREAQELGRFENVHFLGRRPYAHLPALINQLDVCLIPHTVDPLTESMDPIKLYDYLALGKPIVTSHVAGVSRFGHALYVAESPSAFIAQVEAALRETGSALTETRLTLGRDNSWEKRAEQLWQIIEQAATASSVKMDETARATDLQTRVPKRFRGLASAALPRQIRPTWWALRSRRDQTPLLITLRDVMHAHYPVGSNEDHAAAAMRWLCLAQDVNRDGGVSAFYDLAAGRWAPSYPETTGYIIPTFLDYGTATGDNSYQTRAVQMADWLLSVQLESGAFPMGPLWPDLERKPMLFDTGQVIHGLTSMYERVGNDSYLHAALRAGDWLVRTQEPSGTWSRFNFQEHAATYNAEVDWALARLSRIAGDAKYARSTSGHIAWTCSQQMSDGWFRNAGFAPNDLPTTHTIAYTIRGLLESGIVLADQRLIDAGRLAADALRQRQAEDGFLRGTYEEGWRSDVTWSCLTGNAQLAIIWLKLSDLTGDEGYRQAAEMANEFVKRRQPRDSGNPCIDGGVSGSSPIYGDYHPYLYVNWGAKFVIDSLLLEERARATVGVR